MHRQLLGHALEQRHGGLVGAQHHQPHVAVALQQQSLGQQAHAHHALQHAHHTPLSLLEERKPAHGNNTLVWS